MTPLVPAGPPSHTWHNASKFQPAVAYARIQFRHADKERLLQLGTRTTVAGLALLAIAIAASTFVVTQLLYANVYAAVVAGLVAVLLAGTWFVLPLLARHVPGPDAPPVRGGAQ